jgi:TIR domain-containing protein/Golgi phosphoprotein 3 GPP34
MPDAFTHDVFLSHSAKDKAVVRAVAERLRADGLRVWLDDWEIRPGDNIPAKIEEGLEHSRVLVLCMSAHAFGSDWVQLEAGTFRFRDPLNTERRFLPLRLDDAAIKGSLAQFLYINWLPEDCGQEYSKLLNACRATETSVVADACDKDSRRLSPKPIKAVESSRPSLQSKDEVAQPLIPSGTWPTDLTTPEQLHLICANVKTGYTHTQCSFVACGAAALGELVLAKRLKLALEDGGGDTFSVWGTVLDRSPLRDLILDTALMNLVKWSSRSGRVDVAEYSRLGRLFGSGNDGIVIQQLVNKGFLGEENETFLLVFSTTKHPVINTAKQQELRDKLLAAVMANGLVDDRIAIILACGGIPLSYPPDWRGSQKLAAFELAEAKLKKNALANLLIRMIDRWESTNAQPMTAS